MKGTDNEVYDLLIPIAHMSSQGSGKVNCSDTSQKQDTYAVPLHRRRKKLLLKPSSPQQRHSPSCHSPPCAGLVHMLCLRLGRPHPVLCMAPHIQSSACYVFRGDLPGQASVKQPCPHTASLSVSAHHLLPSWSSSHFVIRVENLVFVNLFPPSSLITSETQAIQPTSVLGQNKDSANIGYLKTVVFFF